MITAEELNVMEKIAKEKRDNFIAQTLGVQVPREYGIDTICLVNELRERQSIDCIQVDSLQLT